MKKALLVLLSVMLFVSYLTLGVFAYGQEDLDNEPSASLVGTWRVITYHNNDTPVLIEQEYMVFDETKAADYRNGADTPIAESEYTIADGKLNLPALSKTYILDWQCENVVHFFETPEIYLELVKYEDGNMAVVGFAKEQLVGAWQIVYRRGLELIGEEKLVFDAQTLTDYRGGSSDPTVTAEYVWESDNSFTVDRLAKTYQLYAVTNDMIVLVETDTGYVWLLSRAE